MKISMFKRRALALATGFCAATLSVGTMAAPVTGSFAGMPMPTPDDIVNMVDSNYILESEKAALIAFILNLQTMPEHDNPKARFESDDPDNDPSRIKKFNLVPVFSPVASGKTAGLSIASSALDVVESAHDLYAGVQLQSMESLTTTINNLADSKKKLAEATSCEALPTGQGCTEAGLDDLTPELFAKYFEVLNTEIDERTTLLDELKAKLGDQGAILGIEIVQWIVDQVRIEYSRLGYKATQEELDLLRSDDVVDVNSALASMQANVVSLGTFAVMGINYRGGFTEQQTRFLNAFRAVRPDIKVRTIGGGSTRVMGTESSIYKSSANPSDFGEGLSREFSISPLSTNDTVTSNTNILGVNIGSDGVCGGSTSCAVTVEYTHSGALTIAGTLNGVEKPGIIFASDMTIAAEPFDGELNCDIKLGWTAKGNQSSSSRNGGLFRRSKQSVYDGIKYNSVNNNDCVITVNSGNLDSAHWHLLDGLMKDMDSLYQKNLTPNNEDMLAYEKDMEFELQNQMAGHAPTQGYVAFGRTGLNSWRYSLGRNWYVPIAKMVSFSFGGGGYKYSRTVDKEIMQNYTVDKHIIIGEGTTVNRRVVFDSNSDLCWTMLDGGGSQLEACEWSAMFLATNDASQAIGNCEDNHGVLLGSSECSDIGDDSSVPVDDNDDGIADDPTVEEPPVFDFPPMDDWDF